MALCATVLGLTATETSGAGAIAASSAGALLILRHPALTIGAIVVLLSGLLWSPGIGSSAFYWTDVALLCLAALLPRRMVPALLNAPRWSWPMAMALGALCLAASFHAPAPVHVPLAIMASLCAAFIGAGIARHLAVVDARLLAWGEGGMVEVTRDLLLGRITSGMLHDLAQPLNVISMANANMDYIVGRLEIDEESRRQIQERVARIASHTEGAAHILSLFRWFGRDGREGDRPLTVRSALDCAIATTRSNVRHYGVTVNMRGNALDELVPAQYGALQMMAVAALLSAFGSFLGPNGAKQRGEVLLHAKTTPAHVVLTVECIDDEGQPIPARRIDEATLWLVQQVARDTLGDFRCVVRSRQPVRFVIRLGRQDL
ncbi:sensor histidine kinase [Novosphingobium gossypii]|uniref:hypothetical protein n=1 Tax=Novosphingobium gossypii TaxID=1604774 RepID=UPI003D2441AF